MNLTYLHVTEVALDLGYNDAELVTEEDLALAVKRYDIMMAHSYDMLNIYTAD